MQRTRTQLEAENQELRQRIAVLEQELKETRTDLARARVSLAAAARPPQAPPLAADVMRQILEVVARLSAEDPQEGLVPLSLLRRELPIKRALLDRALLDLERQGKVVLRPVRHPQLVAAETGIEVAERGLLYYVAPAGAR